MQQLSRFYAYVSGFTSTLTCPSCHYADLLHSCQCWAIQTCTVGTPHEREWLDERQKRSSYWCYSGLAGIPQMFYELGGGKCESSNYTNLLKVLHEFANTMNEVHSLMKILNGKITYLVKTTDLVNSKVNQIINSLRLMAGAFSAWQKQLNSLAKLNTCHFNMQQKYSNIHTEI